jgi:NAD(P)-dependent dehydrogenase (short-subunit alcohol dehydrogenase family)
MKTALVTGGSSGLGLAMAHQLAARGYHVVIVAREKQKLADAVAAIRKKGDRATGFAWDIRNHRDVKHVVDSLRNLSNSVDFLILNAGVVHVQQLIDYDDMEQMKQDIETNLWGTILSARTFIPFLTAGSKILFISSGFGLIGAAGYSTYCAAKAGVINFAEALRRELHHKKIAVHVACPGDVDTPSYREECRHMPEWMTAKRLKWASLLSAEEAARRILKKCSGKQFIITSDAGIAALLMLKKIFPSRIVSLIMDNLLPMPPKENESIR